jgi:hypothetical protein
MINAANKANTSSPLDLCTVVVIYDDNATRTRALAACDYLVGQFWENVELDFHWWRTDFLNDPYIARAAAHHAVAADFLIVCLKEPGGRPAALEAWFESWVGKRSNREGALIDLTAATVADRSSSTRRNFLRDVARVGMFDYLTAGPEETETNPPATSVNATDDFFGNPRPPSHFGLND